jgi:hypothetical protein
LRGKEKNRTVNVINDNEWFKKQIESIVSHYLQTSDSETSDLLNDPKGASLIRQIGRDYLHLRKSPLYREHLARLSIISRLCQNMAIVMIFWLLSICISVILLWDELLVVFSSVYIMLAIGLLILFLIMLAIRVFLMRSVDLRRRLVKHTFQSWYLDKLVSTEISGDKNELKKNK